MSRSEMSLGYRKNPLVSIVVPAYNAEQHIDECLRSLANQTYSRIEVIVVDDGSKDRTTDCCLLWKKRDSRFTVFRQANQGVSKARNKGFQEASGKWVLFVDADDQLEPEAIEKAIEVSRDADVVVYGMEIVDEEGISLGEVLPPKCKTMSALALSQVLAKGSFQEYPFCYLFKRALLNSSISNGGPYESDISLFEDAVFVHKVLRAGDLFISCLPETLYRYRRAESSASHRCNPSVAQSGLKAISMLNAMGAPAGCEAEWRAKLVMMAIETADRVAGPGLGDNQAALHRAIEHEVATIASSGVMKFSSRAKTIKYILFRAHLYRLFRRFYRAVKQLRFRHGARSANPNPAIGRKDNRNGQ